MHLQSRSSDKNIVRKVNSDMAFDWENLYNNYSGCMLGVIFSLLKNQKQSEELLQQVFLQLISEPRLLNQRVNLFVGLYVYTFEFTMNYSHDCGIDISKNLSELPAFLQLLVIANKNKRQVIEDNKDQVKYDSVSAFNLDSDPELVAGF